RAAGAAACARLARAREGGGDPRPGASARGRGRRHARIRGRARLRLPQLCRRPRHRNRRGVPRRSHLKGAILVTTYEERREKRRRFLRRNLLWIAPLGLVAGAGVFIGLGFLVAWLWRVTLGDLFGFKPISFWQGWGLILLS